jgi:pimeloyl-ACP methyl ester carboxylesterase
MKIDVIKICIFFALIINTTYASDKLKYQHVELDNSDTKIAKAYKSNSVQVNGLSFHYIEQRNYDAKKPLMILLHGFPYFATAWEPLLEPLNHDYHVVAPDNRGYAYTDKPEGVGDYHIRHLVSDVKTLIDKLSIKNESGQKVTLVGHDWGGVVAWTVAQQYPELIAQVVVINAPPFNTFLRTLSESTMQQEASKYVPWLTSWVSQFAFFVKGPELLWGKSLVMLHKNGHVDDEFKAEFLSAWGQEGAASSAVKWYEANIPDFTEINEQHYWPKKPIKMTVPSLLIWSKNDKAFTQDMLDAIIEDVEHVQVNVIDTSSHAPFLDHTEQVISFMRKFLLETKY